MTLLGERLTSVTQRYRTPTSGEWADGDFIDAGTAMILSSNLAHLQRESVRHLVSALGPGQLTNTLRGYTYSGTELTDTRDPGSYANWNVISWDMQTASVFGPFHLIRDREITGDVPGFRQIRVHIDAVAAASALTLVACITEPGATPTNGPIAFATKTASTGRAVNSLTLTVPPTLGPKLEECRPLSGSTPERVSVVRVALWVGWYAASGTNHILSITADEIR